MICTVCLEYIFTKHLNAIALSQVMHSEKQITIRLKLINLFMFIKLPLLLISICSLNSVPFYLFLLIFYFSGPFRPAGEALGANSVLF